MTDYRDSEPGHFPEDRSEKIADMVEPTMLASIWLGAGGTLAVVFWNLFSA